MFNNNNSRNAPGNSSFLGFRTHSEFSNGICDIFSTQTYIQDGQEIKQQNWKCSPICLNSLFCPYCVLSRQAHSIYLDEAYSYYDQQQRMNSNHSLGITSGNYNNTNNPNDFNHVPVISGRSQQHNNNHDNSNNNNNDDDYYDHRDGASSRTGASSSVAESQHRRRQPIQQQSSTLTVGDGNSNNNNQQQNGGGNAYDHRNNSSNNFDVSSYHQNFDEEDARSLCPILPRSWRTAIPRFFVFLDVNLPPTLHWTCLSAVSIDIANVVVGGFLPVTFAGIWATGLTMQALLTRHLVRKRLGLQPETLQDVFVTVCLPCCAAGQQHMEMEMRRQRSGLRDFDGLVWGHWAAPPRRGIESVIY